MTITRICARTDSLSVQSMRTLRRTASTSSRAIWRSVSSPSRAAAYKPDEVLRVQDIAGEWNLSDDTVQDRDVQEEQKDAELLLPPGYHSQVDQGGPDGHSEVPEGAFF